MVSSVGWTVAVAEDETMSTRSPEPRAGDEKDEEAMANGKERRGKGRYSKFEDRGCCQSHAHFLGGSLVSVSVSSLALTCNSAGPAAQDVATSFLGLITNETKKKKNYG